MSQPLPRISIIIPAYNVESYIDAALQSVFAQTIPPYEIIVVNDGSTDATAERIARYKGRPSFHVISTENQGLGPARNEGLRRATGDYLYFFDSDDLVDEKFLATVSSVIIENDQPDVILFSGKSFVDPECAEDKERNLMRPFYAAGLDGNEAIARLVRAGTPIPTAWLYVSKRNLWCENGLTFKPIIHEDDDTFLPMMVRAKSVVILRDILMYQRIRPSSIMTNGKTPRHAEGLRVAATTLVRLYRDEKHRPAATRRAIRKRSIRTVQRCIRTSRKVKMQVDSKWVLWCARTANSPYLAILGLLGTRRS